MLLGQQAAHRDISSVGLFKGACSAVLAKGSTVGQLPSYNPSFVEVSDKLDPATVYPAKWGQLRSQPPSPLLATISTATDYSSHWEPSASGE